MTLSKFAVAVLVLLCLCLALTGCKPTPQVPENTDYTLQVVTAGGMPLEDINVRVYADATLEDLVWVADTDENGRIAFAQKTSDSYVAVLQDVPAGYAVADSYPVTANTVITLTAQLLTTEEAQGKTFGLGDVMFDFTVTDTAGTTFTLSQLLKEKQAVMLNFWYTGCNPCRTEFPDLQEAYAAYGNSTLEVLALDPVDGSNDKVAQFAQDNSLTFPMISCDSTWESMMKLSAYPTTVVIDRFGTIALVHTGVLTGADSFTAVFDFFTAADYKQQKVTDVEDILSGALTQGTQANPHSFGSVTEFEVTVGPGEKAYCELYRVFDATLAIEGEDITVTCGDATYTPENGVVTIPVNAVDTYTPIPFCIINNGSAEKTCKAYITFAPGTTSNPLELVMDEFTTELKEDNEQGVYYTYTATENGYVTLENLSTTGSASCQFTLYNLTTYTYLTLEEDGQEGKLRIWVNSGDSLQAIVSVTPDETGKYAAATMKMKATFEKGEKEDDGDSSNDAQKKSYSVTITDENGKGLPGISVSFSGVSMETATTDQNGKATVSLPADSYSVSFIAPDGYQAAASYALTASQTSLTIKLTTAMSGKYTNLYVGRAYHMSVGTNKVKLAEGGVNYFIFEPTQEGSYKIAVPTAGAAISYWGGNTSFIFDQSASAGVSGNAFTVNVKESNIGIIYIIGVTPDSGVSAADLAITRTGSAVLDATDMPWTVYTGTHTPAAGFFPADAAGTLTYVDIAQSHTAVKGSDGYYHLDSDDGPILYINLGNSAPYLSFNKMLNGDGAAGGTRYGKYFYNADGSFKEKIDYSDCMQSYIAAMDGKGLYPLTDDLIHMVQKGGSQWWDASNPNYLFSGKTINSATAWMFAVCYFA